MTSLPPRPPAKASRWDQPPSNPSQSSGRPASSSSISIPNRPQIQPSSSVPKIDSRSLPSNPTKVMRSIDSPPREVRGKDREGSSSGWAEKESHNHSQTNGDYNRYSTRKDSPRRELHDDRYKEKAKDNERSSSSGGGHDGRGTMERDRERDSWERERSRYSSSSSRDHGETDWKDPHARDHRYNHSSHHDKARDGYSKSSSYAREDHPRDRRYDDADDGDDYYRRRSSYANGNGSSFYNKSRRSSFDRDDDHYRYQGGPGSGSTEERKVSRDSPVRGRKDPEDNKGVIKKEFTSGSPLSEKRDLKKDDKLVKREEKELDAPSHFDKLKSEYSSSRSDPVKKERRYSSSSDSDSDRSHSDSSTSSTSSTSRKVKFKSESKSRSRSRSKSRSRSPLISQSASKSPEKAKPKATGKGRGRVAKNPRTPLKPVQLINHLPRAENTALKSFIEMDNCTYARGLGKSRGKGDGDGMVCECTWRFGPDPPDSTDACGIDSDCINRLTQVECLESECRCSVSCQNQKFQKKEYADVQVVQTEKKGFGIRAGSEIHNDQFIYEYIGEVVPHEVFMKRMQKYKDEGIQHFYFMMLQKDEYLDATKKGGKGRFLNHSCNPNCYVAKWHVGKHMRMGIFAKRDIITGEELTFNYNVDRYGNDAQECFCGESNCVGSIGGKTQTDIGGMDDLFINALGIEDEVELLEAKGTKKKKSKHLDDDFNPTLRPMEEEEVPKVMTAVRQATDNRGILSKLLSRIHMTEDTQVQKLLVRLHGFSLMSAVLDDWKDDKEIVTLTLGTLARWPLIARNKVVSAGVDQQVKDFCNDKDGEIQNLAKQLIEAWDALEVGYRIAKKEAAERKDGEGEGEDQDDLFLHDRRRDQDESEITLDTAQAPNAISTQLGRIVPRPLGTQVPSMLPPKPSLARLGLLPRSGYHASHHHRSLESPTTPGTPRSPSHHPSIPGASTTSPGTTQTPQTQAPSRSISDIIRMANENEERQRKLKEEEAERERERLLAEEKKSKRSSQSASSNGKHSSDRDREKRRREKEKERERERKKRKLAAEGRESISSDPNGPMDQQTLERKLEKLVGEIAVGAMSKQKDRFEKEEFKRYAKDLTSTICSKEKKNPKSWPPPSGRLDAFSDEKRTKIKAFSKEWITKLLQRKEADENGTLRSAHDISLDSSLVPNASSHLQNSSSSGGSTTTPTEGSTGTTISASISTPKDVVSHQGQTFLEAELNEKQSGYNLDITRDVEMESR